MFQWLFRFVPLNDARDYMGPQEARTISGISKWYFSCQLGDGLCHRSHLLGEPETTIECLWRFLPQVNLIFVTLMMISLKFVNILVGKIPTMTWHFRLCRSWSFWTPANHIGLCFKKPVGNSGDFFLFTDSLDFFHQWTVLCNKRAQNYCWWLKSQTTTWDV